MQVSRLSYHLLPEEPGVYIFLDNKNEVLYVGKAVNLKRRVASYFQNSRILEEITRILVSKVEKIRVIPVQSDIESLLLEINYIKKYTPRYNRKLTDGKAYPLIRITAKERFPKVLTSRRIDDAKSLYFGPFPNASAMRMVLKMLRRIFPYQSSLSHPNKPCLYYHLSLCLCPTVFNNLQIAKQHKKNIRHIIAFLNGKTGTILNELRKEVGKLSKKEQFEEAGEIQKKIQAIALILHPVRQPFEYETNPNLKIDLRLKEMKSLKEILAIENIQIALPRRIECFDISNIQGFATVGSMVVLTNGEKDSSFYRRFKIRTRPDGHPNDFAAMEEVITRRLKHLEWPLPDVLVVDGGKGQVGSALKACAKTGIQIPIIGLAKREETIITSNFNEIHLPKSKEALLLLRRIRDEAHRFAIAYHRKLRSKYALARD